MPNDCISLKKVFNTGWSKLAGNIRLLIKLSLILTGLGIISFLLVIGVQVIANEVQLLKLLYIVVVIAVVTVMYILYMQLIKMSLYLLEDKPFLIRDFFSVPKNIFPFILGLLLYTSIVEAGFILLIVPGIIWALKYSMVPFLIVDRNISAVEALKESARLTQGVKLKLFGFCMLISCVSFISFIPVVMFLCVFFGLFCFTSIYVQLKKSSQESDKV